MVCFFPYRFLELLSEERGKKENLPYFLFFFFFLLRFSVSLDFNGMLRVRLLGKIDV